MKNLISICFILCVTVSYGAEKFGIQGRSLVASSIKFNIQKNVTVTSAGSPTTVVVDDFGKIGINSDCVVAANCKMVLGPGQTLGQELEIVCAHATNLWQLDDDSAVPGGGNHKLEGAGGHFICTHKFQNLKLQWSGGSGHWIEQRRKSVE